MAMLTKPGEMDVTKMRNTPKQTKPGEMDVTKILKEDDLAYIVAAFEKNPDALTDNARAQVVLPYPQAGDAVRTLADYFFVKGPNGFPIDPRQRERSIIGVLSVLDMDPGFVLAVHFYWGLALGLKPKDIAETILLSATYAGIPHWAISIHRFRMVLNLLTNIVQEAKTKCEEKVSEVKDNGSSDRSFKEYMLDELSPPTVADIIRRNTTFASLEEMARLTIQQEEFVRDVVMAPPPGA